VRLESIEKPVGTQRLSHVNPGEADFLSESFGGVSAKHLRLVSLKGLTQLGKAMSFSLQLATVGRVDVLALCSNGFDAAAL
jgi:hypothetical protein